MARPKIPEEQKRVYKVEVLLNEEERRRMNKESARRGLRNNDLFRKGLIALERSPVSRDED